jgi:NAD(P)H-dependent flavin oxidoreductase YrpB (nitropropane dioxygenase family)
MRPRLCEVLGICVPIVLAPFGSWDDVELAAAVCECGALGSIGTALRSPAELRAQEVVRRLLAQARAALELGAHLSRRSFGPVRERPDSSGGGAALRSVERGA